MKNVKIKIGLVVFFCFLIGISFSMQNKVDSLNILLKQAKHDTTRCNIYLKIGDLFEYKKPDSAIFYYKKCLKLAISSGSKNLQISALRYIGNIHKNQSLYDQAIENYEQALRITEEIGDKNGLLKCFTNICIVHTLKGNFPKAIDYFLKSLKISEEVKDKDGMARCYINIGELHRYQGNYSQAIVYYTKSLKLAVELDNLFIQSACYSNIGTAQSLMGNQVQSLENFKKACANFEKLGNRGGMGKCYTNIGLIYKKLGDYDKALDYYQKSLRIDEEFGDKDGMTACYINLAVLNLNLADSVNEKYTDKRLNLFNKALDFGEKAMLFAKESGAIPDEKSAAQILMNINRKMGNYKVALEYAEIFMKTNDSLFNLEKTQSLADAEAKYESEKKQLLIEKLDKDRQLQMMENKKQKIVIGSIISGLLLIGVFAIFVVNRLRITRKQKNLIEKQKQIVEEKNTKLNQQNDEIRNQRDEIETQKDEITAQRDLVTCQKEELETQRDLLTIQKNQIEEIHYELTDSIRYAEKIQKALLPVSDNARGILGEHFILFKPKDIVSGDFYFAEKRKNILFIAVADCTGHGVPGAFMSMLGVSFLNEIISKENDQTASQILDKLRNSVINSLQQKGIYGEQKDGMDIVFVALDTETNIIQFAGANNSLWIIKESSHTEKETVHTELTEVKPDKMPVAIYERMEPFTNHIIQLQKGDILYLGTDGYEDQFGGPKGKKFMSKQLRQLLVENCKKTMPEQRDILDYTLEKWINGFEVKCEQIDDITIMGIKI